MGVEAAVAAVAVSALASAGTAVYAGHQQAAAATDAAEAQAAQYAEEAQAARLAAQQEEVARRRDLGRALSAMDALRAGRGLDLMSGTGEALYRASTEAAAEDITTIRANANRSGRRLGLAADSGLRRANNAAEAAVVSGYGQAVGSLAGGVSQGYGIMRRTGT